MIMMMEMMIQDGLSTHYITCRIRAISLGFTLEPCDLKWSMMSCREVECRDMRTHSSSASRSYDDDDDDIDDDGSDDDDDDDDEDDCGGGGDDDDNDTLK